MERNFLQRDGDDSLHFFRKSISTQGRNTYSWNRKVLCSRVTLSDVSVVSVVVSSSISIQTFHLASSQSHNLPSLNIPLFTTTVSCRENPISDSMRFPAALLDTLCTIYLLRRTCIYCPCRCPILVRTPFL